RALLPFTVSGRTAAILATYRPELPILACATSEATSRRLVFWRGVHPRVLRPSSDLARLFAAGVRSALRARLLEEADVVLLVGGHALARGSSNTLQVVRAEAGTTKRARGASRSSRA